MKHLPLVIILIFLFSSVFFGINLKLVKTLGTSQDEYYLHSISGAVISKQNDIYILEFKKACLSKFNWEGKFINKIGKLGHGPQDMHIPRYLDIYSGKLYFGDVGNLRIGEVDLNLKQIKYTKFKGPQYFINSFNAINKNLFISGKFAYNEDMNLINVFDIKNSNHYSFFDIFPVKQINKDYTKKAVFEYMHYTPIFGINRKQKKILCSHMYSSNPIKFYVYSLKGDYLDDFIYELDKAYKFPYHYLKRNRKYPKNAHTPYVDSLFIHKNYYIVNILLSEYKTNNERKRHKLIKTDRFFLVFDQKTKQLKAKIKVSKKFKAFYISDNDILLAREHDSDENEVLSVYKLNF